MKKDIKKPKILVVGSLVMDLIVTTERFCNAGETVIKVLKQRHELCS